MLDNTKSTLIDIANFCMSLKNDIAGKDFFTILKDSYSLMKGKNGKIIWNIEKKN